MMDEMSRQYQKVDPRYLIGPMRVSGQSVFWTSMCEIFFQSPFCLLVFFAYHRGKPWRRGLEIIVSILHVAGVWWFYVRAPLEARRRPRKRDSRAPRQIPEWFADFQHLGGWPPNKFGGHFSIHSARAVVAKFTAPPND